MLPETGPGTLRLGTILLGAGASSRMGRPKLLLPWGSNSVLGHHLAIWRRLGAEQIAVVCAPDPHPGHDELDRLSVPLKDRILNPNPDRGMFSSIQCAARWQGWKPNLARWALVLGDQPHVSIEALGCLLAFSAGHPTRVVQPSRHGRPRHPVIFPRDAFQGLAVSEAANLKQFLQALSEPAVVCEIDDPALDLDLDTPSDYQRALREFGARS
jgi:molybdenum cofactor cytidylyltransferase